MRMCILYPYIIDLFCKLAHTSTSFTKDSPDGASLAKSPRELNFHILGDTWGWIRCFLPSTYGCCKIAELTSDVTIFIGV